MSDQEIRAKALELAVHAQAARGISDPSQITVLAELYAVYIRDGAEAIAGMLKMPPWGASVTADSVNAFVERQFEQERTP